MSPKKYIYSVVSSDGFTVPKRLKLATKSTEYPKSYQLAGGGGGAQLLGGSPLYETLYTSSKKSESQSPII